MSEAILTTSEMGKPDASCVVPTLGAVVAVLTDGYGTGIRVPGYPFQYPSGTRVFKYPKVWALISSTRPSSWHEYLILQSAKRRCIAVGYVMFADYVDGANTRRSSDEDVYCLHFHGPPDVCSSSICALIAMPGRRPVTPSSVDNDGPCVAGLYLNACFCAASGTATISAVRRSERSCSRAE